MDNQNYNGQLMYNQLINNQQPMNNQQINNNPPKKKNTPLIIVLSIIGIFILGIIVFFIIFSISENQDTPWKSGQVEILGKKIQLPCDVSEFEKTLNTKIINDDIWDGIVRIPTGYNSELIFKVNIENDKVTGIIIDIYPSDADEYDKILEANERNIANKIVFPGNITSDSTVDVVKETYKTKPINVYYNHFSETIEKMTDDTDGLISSSYGYHDNEWEIEIHTDTNIKKQKEEITEINYWCLN